MKGFIYLNHPLLDNTPYWEFALSSRGRLHEVTRSDVPSEFYGMNDPRGLLVFGQDWNGHTLRVPDGEVLFARVVTNRSIIYAVHVCQRPPGDKRGRMRVKYVRVGS